MKHLPCVLVLLSLAVCTACEQQEPKVDEETAVTSRDVKKEMGEAVSTTMEFSQQEMEEYRHRVRAKIEELDKDIATVKARVLGSSPRRLANSLSSKDWMGRRMGPGVFSRVFGCGTPRCALRHGGA